MTDQPAFVPSTDPTVSAPPAPAPAPAAPTIGRGSIVSTVDGDRFGIVVHAPAGDNPHVLWLGEATEAVMPLLIVRA